MPKKIKPTTDSDLERFLATYELIQLEQPQAFGAALKKISDGLSAAAAFAGADQEAADEAVRRAESGEGTLTAMRTDEQS